MKEERLTNLDIVKLFAAVIIVFHHFQLSLHFYMPIFNFYGGAVNFGYIVELFFMIAGFLAVRNYRKDTRGVKMLLYKYLVFLLQSLPAGLFILCLSLYAHNKFYVWICDTPVDINMAIRGLLLINRGLVYPVKSLNNPLWCFPIMLSCFAVFYFIKWLCRKTDKIHENHMYAFVIALCFILNKYMGGVYLPFFNYEFYLCGIAFFIGCIFYGVLQLPHKHRMIARCAMLLAAVITALAVGVTNRAVAVICIYPAIIDISVNSAQAKGLAERIGGLSTSLYIWHMPGIFALYTYIYFALSAGKDFIVTPAKMIAFTALLIVFSIIWDRIYTRPVLKKIKKVILKK